MPTTFTAGLQTSLSPWNDPAGNWQALNAALAAMFEQVYGIVSDQGTPDCPPVGLTSAPLSTAAAITTLPVQAALQPIASGTLVMVVSSTGQQWQNFTTATAVAQGATSIPVVSQTPSFAFPAGSFVALGYQASWSSLLDPNVCPTWALPYAGQFVGVQIPSGTDDATARAKLKAESGFQRGTSASIIAAAKNQLTGTQSVTLLERTGGTGTQPNGQSGSAAYSFVLVVRPSEVVSLAALTNATAAVKPAGLTFQIVQTDSFTWNQAVHTWTGDTMTWNATGSTQP